MLQVKKLEIMILFGELLEGVRNGKNSKENWLNKKDKKRKIYILYKFIL